MLRSRTLRVSYITHRLLSLDEGRPVTTEMVRQEVGHSATSKTIERVYARVSRRRQRLDPFAFRIESYVDLPEIRAALRHMGEEDAAAAARAAVPSRSASASRRSSGPRRSARSLPKSPG